MHGKILVMDHMILNPKSDCIYHFPIDFDPNERPVGSKSIGKW